MIGDAGRISSRRGRQRRASRPGGQRPLEGGGGTTAWTAAGQRRAARRRRERHRQLLQHRRLGRGGRPRQRHRHRGQLDRQRPPIRHREPPGSIYNDRLAGNDGANRLQGLGGGDVLVGRGGADRSTTPDRYDSNPKAPDRILDFSRSQGDRSTCAKSTPTSRWTATRRSSSSARPSPPGRAAALFPVGRRHVHRCRYEQRNRRRGAAYRARRAVLAAGHRLRPVAGNITQHRLRHPGVRLDPAVLGIVRDPPSGHSSAG